MLGLEWDELEQRNRHVQQAPQRIFVLGAVVVVVVMAWAHFYSESRESATSPDTPGANIIEMLELATPQATEPQASHYQGARPARTGHESYVDVYECVVDGQRVVSDRPCAVDAKSRTLVVDQPDPREVARLQQQMPRTGSRGYTSRSGFGGEGPTVSGSAEPSNASACAAVDKAIDNINSRMRAGYGPEEGEWLRQRWHELKRSRYDLRCGR